MPYNWKCCSLYPNNFGASALPMEIRNSLFTTFQGEDKLRAIEKSIFVSMTSKIIVLRK